MALMIAAFVAGGLSVLFGLFAVALVIGGARLSAERERSWAEATPQLWGAD